MGALCPHKRHIKEMRALIVFVALAAFAAAEFAAEDILLETQADVSNMKKKGATNADCLDLAKTTCKDTIAENKRAQTSINSVSDGSKCHLRGRRGVIKALAHYRRTKKTWMTAKVSVTTASNAYVKITSQKFSTLKFKKCQFVFTSRSYRSAKAKYNRAVRVELSWRGRVSESHKMYLRYVKIAALMVRRCHCSTKLRATARWTLETKKSHLVQMAKAFAKCKMMQCVLNGTKLTDKKCRGKLKTLVKKTLSKSTQKVVCKGTHKKKGPDRKELRAKALVKARKAKVAKEKKTKAAAKEKKAKATVAKEKKTKKETANKRAEKSRKARAKESSVKKFKEKNKKGRERATKREKRLKTTEKKNKERKNKAERSRKKAIALARAKRERSAKAERRKAVERQNKEKVGKKNAWHLAMTINGATSTFNYNSAYWTNGRTGNFGSGNSKTAWFNKPARQIRLVMKYGRNTRQVSYRHNTNLSLTQLFKGGHRGTRINVHSWRHLGGNNVFGFQNHCNKQGFNTIARGGNFQKTDIRFGIVMNQENNCGSPDSSIGIGMKDAGVTAGGNCRCCNNGGSCGIKKATAYVYVKQA